MGPWGVGPTPPTAAARVFASLHEDVLFVIVVVVAVVVVAVVVAVVISKRSPDPDHNHNNNRRETRPDSPRRADSRRLLPCH